MPNANAVKDEDWPFFLPLPGRRDGFLFTLNPTAAPQDQVSVEVAATIDLCARAVGTAADINSTVCAGDVFKWRDRSLKKIGDGVFWQYTFSSGEAAANTIVVRCFKLEGNVRNGLCTAVLPRGDLALTFHLTDNLTPRMQELYDEASADLASWARR